MQVVGRNQVIQEEAEEILVDAVYSLTKFRHHWKGLHFQLSRLPTDSFHEADLARIIERICHIIPQTESAVAGSSLTSHPQEAIYACQDRDLLLLCRSQTRELLNGLVEEMQMLCTAETLESDPTQLIIHYDLDEQYEEFYFFCNQKRRRCIPNFLGIAEARNAREIFRVMLVEDDVFSVALVNNLVRPHHEMVVAENAVEAIRKYEAAAPDIVFLDIGLPNIDGLEVLKEILATDPHAYVVMFSAQGYFDNVRIAIDNGAKGFISKPFSKLTLDNYIGRCAAERAERRSGVL